MPENQKNLIRFDLTDNPELADVFLSKELGDKCKLQIEFVVTEKTNDYVAGKVRTVIAPDAEVTETTYDPASGEEETKTSKRRTVVKPDSKAPISVLFGSDY